MTASVNALTVPASSGASLSENYAAILHGVNDLRFEKAPALGDLKAGMASLGFWEVSGPLVLGHEAAGMIVEVSKGVEHLQVGDRVTLEPGCPCWASTLARSGRYNISPGFEGFGCPMLDGALRNVMDHHADFCFKLPDNVSFEEGALCEPLSVGIHACRRGCVQPGKSVLILGAGPIGLMTLIAARAFGATKIMMTDISTHNLALADKMGATKTCCHPKAASPQDIASKPKDMLTPNIPEIIFDCVGMESTIRTAVFTAAPGSKIVIVGLGQENATVPLSMLTLCELDVLGSMRYTNTYPLCLSLLEDKSIDVLAIISHRVGFSDKGVARGFDIAARSAETKAVKVMVNL